MTETVNVEMAESAPKTHSNISPDEDIFDSVIMAEERFHEKGFREGFAAGQIAGEREGFKMGQDKARQIGSEYGFYWGFVVTWQQLIMEDSGVAKIVVKALDALNTMLASFKVDELTMESYWEDFKKIRDKFKQVASLLKVSVDFTDNNAQGPPLSF